MLILKKYVYIARDFTLEYDEALIKTGSDYEMTIDFLTKDKAKVGDFLINE